MFVAALGTRSKSWKCPLMGEWINQTYISMTCPPAGSPEPLHTGGSGVSVKPQGVAWNQYGATSAHALGQCRSPDSPRSRSGEMDSGSWERQSHHKTFVKLSFLPSSCLCMKLPYLLTRLRLIPSGMWTSILPSLFTACLQLLEWCSRIGSTQ